MERGTSRFAIDTVIRLILAFAYVARHVGGDLATQSIVREMVASRAVDMDRFIAAHYDPTIPIDAMITRCIAALPDAWQKSTALHISPNDFIIPASAAKTGAA